MANEGSLRMRKSPCLSPKGLMIPSLRQLRANYHSIGRQGHNPEAGILPRVMDPIRISVCLNNIYKTSLPTPTCVSQQFIVLLFSNTPVNSLIEEAA